MSDMTPIDELICPYCSGKIRWVKKKGWFFCEQ